MKLETLAKILEGLGTIGLMVVLTMLAGPIVGIAIPIAIYYLEVHKG